MRVAMIGTGYVGLVSGACFADFGHEVTCVDKDTGKIAALTRGEVPIFEPGLNDLVAANTRAGRLTFTNDLAGAVKAADAVFIAVGTPSRRGDGHADLTFVYDAAREIAGALDGFTVIITKSTVPVGTGDEVERIIREARTDAEFAVVSNPEFLREGAAIQDFKHPDRVVVGSEDARARGMMTELYRPLYLNRSPILFTDRRTAELIKYAANAFLATKITFINEIADLAEKVGADVQEVARGIGLDNRHQPASAPGQRHGCAAAGRQCGSRPAAPGCHDWRAEQAHAEREQAACPQSHRGDMGSCHRHGHGGQAARRGVARRAPGGGEADCEDGDGRHAPSAWPRGGRSPHRLVPKYREQRQQSDPDHEYVPEVGRYRGAEQVPVEQMRRPQARCVWPVEKQLGQCRPEQDQPSCRGGPHGAAPGGGAGRQAGPPGRGAPREHGAAGAGEAGCD